MSLTQDGIDYICQNFGDSSFCCIDTGLGWTYYVGGTGYNETGGTAQIVSRLASGLIESLEMTNPPRGSFTQTDLNNANGQAVTLQDAQIIAQHDNPSEDQWCLSGVSCEQITDESSCLAANCYWYNNSCHSSPYIPPAETPWYFYLGVGALVVASFGIVAYVIVKK